MEVTRLRFWLSLFLPAVLGESGLGIIPVDIPVQGSLLLLTFFGLTGIAFLVTRVADGKAGTRALRRHYYQFRAAPQWYLGAVFGPPLVLLVAGLAVNAPAFSLRSEPILPRFRPRIC